MPKFSIFWRDGKRDVLQGKTVADALTQAGYGQGALAALDFHAKGDCKEWEWSPTKREWERIVCIDCGAAIPKGDLWCDTHRSAKL